MRRWLGGFLAILLVAGPASAQEARSGALFPCTDEAGLWGYIGADGVFAIAPQFRFAGDFSEGLAQVTYPDDRTGFIDTTGRLQFEGSASLPFVGGVAMVVRFWVVEDPSGDPSLAEPHQKFGMIDRKGRMVGKADLDGLGEMHEGLAAAKRGGRWGFIDARGRAVIPFRYDSAPGDFSEGLASVQIKGRHGYIDRKGRVAIAPTYDAAEPFHDGFAVVRKDGRTFYIDRKGKPAFGDLALMQIWWTPGFSEGIAPVVTADGRRGILDGTGKIVVDGAGWTWRHFRSFHEGLAVVSVDEGNVRKFGFVDTTGKVVVAPVFTGAGDFQGGLARVSFDAKRFGYVDRTGRVVRECSDPSR